MKPLRQDTLGLFAQRALTAQLQMPSLFKHASNMSIALGAVDFSQCGTVLLDKSV